jgi:hypothetical protein
VGPDHSAVTGGASIIAMGDTGDRDVKQFNVYLAAELIREVKHHAVDTEQSLSAIVTTALERYLRQQQNRKRKA